MAQKILITLVSDSTISNVLLIKQFKDIEKYIFISSQMIFNKGCLDWVINSSAIDKSKVAPVIIVSEYSFEDIENKLNALNFDDNDDIYVNITGGTKIMSLAVYDYFHELGAKIYYVVQKNMEYVKLFPKSKNKVFKIESDISVKEYLAAYGFSVVQDDSQLHTADTTENVFNFFKPYFEPNAPENPYIHVIGELQSHRNKNSIATSIIPGLQTMLDKMNFVPDKQGVLTKNDIVYLTGGWFEEFVHNKVKKEFNLSDDKISTGLNISKNGVPNELDVVFTFENNIYVIECKTSVYYFENGKKKTTIGDFVYKSDSLQSELGLNPVSAIATLSALRDNIGNFNPIVKPHIKRAEQYGISIIAFAELTSGKSFKEMLNNQ